MRLELTRTPCELSEAPNAIEWMARCMPSPESPDYKPDDPEYQALRAQASSTLDVFSQFLSTSAAIKLASEVNNVFNVLRDHGEKAGLLSPPLIGAMSGYLDKCKNAYIEFVFNVIMGIHEEWIRTLYRNLKPDDSEQVCLLPFSLYESALTSNFTLIQNPNAAASVVASASANAAHSDNPPVQSAVAAADITTNCASNPLPSVQGASSALPEGSCAEASPLASFAAPSTNPIQDSASVELTPSTPMSEDAPQADPGLAWIDSGEVSETPAHADEDGVSETPALVGSGGTYNANPQETELSSTKIPSIPQPAIEISGHADPSE